MSGDRVFIFLLGLKHTLRTCFESKKFSSFNTPLFSLPNLLVCTLQNLLATLLKSGSQVSDIMDDLQLISRTVIFRFGEINKS